MLVEYSASLWLVMTDYWIKQDNYDKDLIIKIGKDVDNVEEVFNVLDKFFDNIKEKVRKEVCKMLLKMGNGVDCRHAKALNLLMQAVEVMMLVE